jgi:S1-C subfamily serine protease
VNSIDWIVLALVVALAILGAQEGLLAGAFSVVGLVGGAALGGRLAPVILSDGSRSPYAPLVALGVAAAVAVAVQSLGLSLGLFLRRSLLRPESLRAVDSLGGLVLGAAAGFALAWVLGVVALQLPGQTRLRRQVQGSLVLRRLNEILPPERFLRVLARFDPLPALGGPLARVAAPDPAVLRLPGVRAAAPSVVRILGTACGLGVEGSGWVARPGLVVTAAHVVAGESDTVVEPLGSSRRLSARAVAFDSHNDVAVLRVPRLSAGPLRLVDARPGAPVAILGYPGDGSFTARPGRIGVTTFALTQDAYGRGPVGRTVTTLRARIRHGDSGGPAVDRTGAVQTTVYAARVGAVGSGFGVPTTAVRTALRSAGDAVSTGPCVP